MGMDRGKSESGIHWAWVVLGSSFITLFITCSIRIGAYSVLLPEMIKDFRITKAEAGMYLFLLQEIVFRSWRLGSE